MRCPVASLSSPLPPTPPPHHSPDPSHMVPQAQQAESCLLAFVASNLESSNPLLFPHPGIGGRHGNPLQYSCLENPHGQRCLAGYSPWGCKELDKTGQLSMYACMSWNDFLPDSAWLPISLHWVFLSVLIFIYSWLCWTLVVSC